MSYLSRLMQETGLSPTRHAPVARPAPGVDTVVLEIDDSVDTARREVESVGTSRRDVESVDTSRRDVESAVSQAKRPPQLAAAEQPVHPPVPWARQPAFDTSALRLDHVPPPIETAPDQATSEPPMASEPPMVPEPAPQAAVEGIEIETRVEQTVAELAPSPTGEGNIALHGFRTIEDVRHWVASGPQAAGVTEPSSGVTPLEALASDVEPLPAREPPRARSRPPMEPRPDPLPDVHDVTLSIGRIDVTVEAPAAPPPPAPVQAPSPSSETASSDTAVQRLRRHYVNWPGGG